MTLVELMVVVAIFIVVTGITIFDYSSFKSSVSLNNLANDISLSIRKAQSYAIGAKGSGGYFTDGYGVHFSTDNNSSFAVFADNSSNVIEELYIKGGDHISGFIIGNDTDIKEGDLNISFIRPDPDAIFSFNNSNKDVFKVEIILSNKNNDKYKKIEVTNTGQISVKNYE